MDTQDTHSENSDSSSKEMHQKHKNHARGSHNFWLYMFISFVVGAGLIAFGVGAAMILDDDESTTDSTGTETTSGEPSVDLSNPDSLLFVQNTTAGTLVKNNDDQGSYTLTFTEPEADITYFVERPGVGAGVTTFSDMVDALYDPSLPVPNADLVINEGQASIPVELEDPQQNDDGSIQYTVIIITETGPDGEIDPRGYPETFGTAELFIDSSKYSEDCDGSVVTDVDLSLNVGKTSPSPYSSHWDTVPESVDAFGTSGDAIFQYAWDGATGKTGPSFDIYYDASGYDATFKLHTHCWSSFWNGAEARSASCTITGNDADRFNCSHSIDKEGQQTEHAANFNISLK